MQILFPSGEDPLEEEKAPTLIFLPGKFHGQRSLVDCRPQGCKESDTTEHNGTVTQDKKIKIWLPPLESA